MKTGKLEDVKVNLQVVLGETEISVGELARVKEGTIIGLKSLAGEPVDLFAAGCPVAKGEVVVIDENFGIRITGMIREGGLPDGTENER